MQRSVLLDLLRTVAIALVLVAHIGQHLDLSIGGFFGIKNFYYVSLGGVGVTMFLVLSGLLARLVEAKKQSPYFSYMAKKVLRIYPMYWIAVIVGFLGYLIGGGVLRGDSVEHFPSGVFVDLFGSVSGFYSWMGLWGGPYNPPTWFIALIMALYALFPLLLFAIRRWSWSTLATLLLISVTSRLYLSEHALPFGERHFWDGIVEYAYRQYGFMPGRPADWFPLCRLFEFGLGIFLAEKVPTQSWALLNGAANRLTSYLSDIAFPVFLIHFPFLFLVDWFSAMGFHDALAISAYLLLVLILADFLSRIDRAVPRKVLLAHLSRLR